MGFVLALGWAVAACSSLDSKDADSGNPTAGTGAGTLAVAGTGAGGDETVGSAGTSGTSAPNVADGGDVPDAARDAATPSGPPTHIVVETHEIGVDAKGSVFNVADNYFNDGLVPPTPVANFGCHSQIISVAHDDGSLDVAWLDYAGGSGQPWALRSPGMINLTHIAADLTTATTTKTGIESYKLLGFTMDASGAFYIAYNKDHALKNDVKDDPNNLDGNELHLTKLVAGAAAWDKVIFGDQDNGGDASLGDPGGAASGVLGFDATAQKVVLYMGHSMMWIGSDGKKTRHQAGFLRVIDAGSGDVAPPAGDDVVHFGSGWWYSHNFNQRLIVDGSSYYVLAHGDSFPRQLGFAKWSLASYMNDNDTEWNESYWDIAGNQGDNDTDAQTGQFVRMPDGRFLMVHTTSQGRSARDVRLVFADGATGKADDDHAVWVTTNDSASQATMPKLEVLGDYVFVTYALWDSDSESKHDLSWYTALFDATTLEPVIAPTAAAGFELVDAAPLFRFASGPNAGNVAWVSGNASHTLSVHVASLGY